MGYTVFVELLHTKKMCQTYCGKQKRCTKSMVKYIV